MTARGVYDSNIEGKATKMNSGEFADMSYLAKHVISF